MYGVRPAVMDDHAERVFGAETQRVKGKLLLEQDRSNLAEALRWFGVD
jgi:hypothetical protein